MKSIKFLTSNNLNELMSNYNLNNLKVVEYESNSIIIFLDFQTIENLAENWKNINNVLSEDIDEFINTLIMRWNVYCIYTTIEDLNKELKYKIQNNTFFARKIVEDNYTLDLSEENIKKLISSHISFDDLDIKGTRPKNEEYTSDSKVYKELSEIDKLDDDKIDTILKSLEKDD